jgi:hypothetical protein
VRSRVEWDQGSSAAPLYDRDFALWIEAQVAALRAGNAAALDIQNLILELEGLTKRDERALGSQLKLIMARLLMQRYRPRRASRSWAESITNGREKIADIVEQSPNLRRILPALMTRNYPRAAAQAARDTRMPIDDFPRARPSTSPRSWARSPRPRRRAWRTPA